LDKAYRVTLEGDVTAALLLARYVKDVRDGVLNMTNGPDANVALVPDATTV
jgi:hypothetical protein